MKDRVKESILELDYGIIPFELMYGLEPQCKIDWLCLRYNDWDYVDYWEQKQPEGLLDQFPCLFSWVESIAESRKGITPLQELEERRSLLELNQNLINLRFE